VNSDFWQGKRVFLTGHTGFKGSWLSLWLKMMGAEILGFSTGPLTNPNLYSILSLDSLLLNITGDILDYKILSKAISKFKPQIVIHMAAQSLVRRSYNSPLETIAVNITGTANLLEACRIAKDLKVILNVTSDKCYKNQEWLWGYRENEQLGGIDPYSCSKSCSELITKSYRESFFNQKDYDKHGVAIATARAGNVIGGGDWSEDRLIPDCILALTAGKKIKLRNPNSIRPWQYVLDPLHGYLLLIEKLFESGPRFSGSWNFGPNEDDAKEVRWIVDTICRKMNHKPGYETNSETQPHEANFLKLDCSKSKSLLKWKPKMRLAESINEIIFWTKAYMEGKDMKQISIDQVNSFLSKEGEV